MDRGCFTYDQETTNPEVLSFIGTNDTTSGFESRYEAGDEKFVIKAEHRNGMIRVELIAPENCRYNRFNISIPVEKGLHYYGCGETHHALDLRGHKVRIFVAEHQNIKRTDKKMELFGPLEEPEGNLFDFDEGENTITFWHCGMAACSLAREDTGACIGEHCNRHIGPTLEFGCKATPEVTIFRVGRSPEGKFRFFIAQGEAMDKPKQFFGTSLSVRTEGSAEKIVDTTVREGWEPHYAVIYGNCADSLEILGHMLDLEVERF